MKALTITPSTGIVAVEEVPVPVPGPGEVLIKVHAVSLNPVDEFYVSSPIATQDRRVVGTDFAGVVVEASRDIAEMQDPRVQREARVAGFHQGASSVNDRPGAFAEYVTAPYDLLWLVPDTITLQAASTVSMCSLTAAQALFDRLKLPSPFSSGTVPPGDTVNLLIYGSSTSLGQFAAQLAHFAAETSGRKFNLIGTASAFNHQFLSQAPYNYDVLIDYHDSDWPDKVKAATGGVGVHFALDTISEFDTVEKVHSTLGENGKFHVFRSPGGGQFDLSSLKIQPIYDTVWEGLGVEVDYGDGLVFSAKPEARDFAARFFQFLGSEAPAGKAKLQPNPVRNMPGGLKKIRPDGLALLSGLVTKRNDTDFREDHMRPISAEKLVYTVQ
ncbi:chaperonin 10-like protein [Fusarium oxysporum]|nr:chaperonin 10-like protein [Fusarium oxysporum]